MQVVVGERGTVAAIDQVADAGQVPGIRVGVGQLLEGCAAVRRGLQARPQAIVERLRVGQAIAIGEPADETIRVVADAGGVSAERAPAAAGSGELRRFTKSIGAIGNAQGIRIGQVGTLAQGVVLGVERVGPAVDLGGFRFQQIPLVVAVGPGGGRVGDAGGIAGGVVTVAHVVGRAGIVVQRLSSAQVVAEERGAGRGGDRTGRAALPLGFPGGLARRVIAPERVAGFRIEVPAGSLVGVVVGVAGDTEGAALIEAGLRHRVDLAEDIPANRRGLAFRRGDLRRVAVLRRIKRASIGFIFGTEADDKK